MPRRDNEMGVFDGVNLFPHGILSEMEHRTPLLLLHTSTAGVRCADSVTLISHCHRTARIGKRQVERLAPPRALGNEPVVRPMTITRQFNHTCFTQGRAGFCVSVPCHRCYEILGEKYLLLGSRHVTDSHCLLLRMYLCVPELGVIDESRAGWRHGNVCAWLCPLANFRHPQWPR